MQRRRVASRLPIANREYHRKSGRKRERDRERMEEREREIDDACNYDFSIPEMEEGRD